ncbi:hypothetical protein AALP_AA1G319700 [Arabis alpina]|uniref:Uncharacterized protein n=1 Tax=Arabis alpina TaxID=50452 RepID=A0A087HS17_ARAAL|nr:hypothetical protein AALP_AA1G319700 [Arabis alpina]
MFICVLSAYHPFAATIMPVVLSIYLCPPNSTRKQQKELSRNSIKYP